MPIPGEFIKKNSLVSSLLPERVVQQWANVEPDMVSLNALVQKFCQVLLSNLPLGLNGSPIQRVCESSCVGRRLFDLGAVYVHGPEKLRAKSR